MKLFESLRRVKDKSVKTAPVKRTITQKVSLFSSEKHKKDFIEQMKTNSQSNSYR